MTLKSFWQKVLENLASKRTWVFLIATVALFTKFITEWAWLPIATIYLGEKVIEAVRMATEARSSSVQKSTTQTTVVTEAEDTQIEVAP
jgi:hypothetical protein